MDGFRIVSVFLLILWGWFNANGVDGTDAMAASLVVLFQAVIGLPLAVALFRIKFTLSGLLGVSLALGSIQVTIVDQLSVALGIPVNISISLLLLPLLTRSFRASLLSIPRSTTSDYRLMLISPIAVMMGVGAFDQRWMISISILVVTICVTFFRAFPNLRVSTYALTIFGVLSWTLFLLATKPLSQPYGKLVYRPLYTGSDDQIFSESLGWSLSHFGVSEYAAAIGTSVRYHWFSLAWSGFTEKLSGVEPLVTTLHVVPTVAFIVIALVSYEITRIAADSSRAAFFSLFVLFGTSLLFSPERFFHVVNTSNIAPFMWLGLLLLSLVAHANRKLRYSTLVLPGLLSIILLSKAPFGVSAGVGVFVSLLWMWRHQQSAQLAVQSVLTVLVTVFTYLVFLSPHRWEQRAFQLDWNFGGIGLESSYYPLVVLIVVAATFSTVGIGYLPIIGKRLDVAQQVTVSFLIVASSVGVLRFVLSGGSAELYFFNVTIYLSSIAAGLGSRYFLEGISIRRSMVLLGVAMLSFLTMSFELWHSFLQNVYSNPSVRLIVPLGIGIVVSLPFLLLGRYSHHGFMISWSSALVVATVFASSAILANKVLQPADYSSPADIASNEEIEALDWLRANSSTDSVVATNRTLCRPSSRCNQDESRYLVSAFAKRRVLLEGPRFVVGGRPYPEWVEERIDSSLDFAQTPDQNSVGRLLRSGVSWFYLLKSESTPSRKIFAQFGSVDFENSSVLIVHFPSVESGSKSD